MKCVVPDEVMKAVMSHLRRTRQTVANGEGGYVLVDGIPNINAISAALAEGAISMMADGSINVCGTTLASQWDTTRIRRRVEDHLRKTASKNDIIRIAACLGINLQ